MGEKEIKLAGLCYILSQGRHCDQMSLSSMTLKMIHLESWVLLEKVAVCIMYTFENQERSR